MKIYQIVFLAVYCLSAYSSNVFGLSVGPENEKKPSEILAIEKSQLYGHWLFNGGFAKTSFSGVNPNYRIAQGDKLLVQLWGGIDYQQEVMVDPQGNIFVPKVGPVRVLGVQNSSLNEVVLKSIKRVYKANVEAYVALASSQTVKVFVSGMVKQPGIYEGQSADSVLRYIDQAGGIKEDLGSYRNILIKRQDKLIATIDLYTFIESGEMANIQLQDGDLIFVGVRQGVVNIEGESGFQGRYELAAQNSNLKDILAAVGVNERATHVTLVVPEGQHVNAVQYSVDQVAKVDVVPGTLIKLSSQLRAESISVEVLGEHESTTEMVLPWGATLADLQNRIKFTELSAKGALQLFRQSVAKRQKEMLMASLSALEQSALTSTSATKEAAQLRQIEGESILAWIERAKNVEPRGQVLLAEGFDPAKVLLKQGDRVVIPQKSNLVMVHGEVLFPTAITYESGKSLVEYVEHAGGATKDLDDMNILLMRTNGSFEKVVRKINDDKLIRPGDEIFVLARPELKALQLTKDISQVIYQIAVSAAVALAL